MNVSMKKTESQTGLTDGCQGERGWGRDGVQG